MDDVFFCFGCSDLESFFSFQIRWVVDLHVVTVIARTSHSPSLVSTAVSLTLKCVGRHLVV